MTDFLIKSTVAMGVLLGLYHLLLEKEKMHRFNRFYLLGALVFSLALPFITVITYVQEIPQSDITPTITSLPTTVTVIEEQPVDYLFYIGWITYPLVTFILVIRFIKNIIPFFRKAKSNPLVLMGKAKLVLLEEKVLPHTFLNYIFINREEYEAKLIEDELYTHEYTHVKQFHTLDILFIEALKTIFWFNPLLYFYKKAIQLNHEFLADEKVIDATANTIYYQNLLLEKANVGTTFSMASNLTFSLTKKRFIMMTKTTTSVKAGLLKLVIAPVITVIILLLCTETVAQEKLSDIPAEKIKTLDINKKVTQKQVDSLRKANPKVYKSKKNNDYAEAKVTYTDKDGKLTKKKFFIEGSDSKKTKKVDEQIKSEFSDIPSDKIKSMNVSKNVTQQQVDSLKTVKPKAYTSNNPKDYGIIDLEYTDTDGKIVKKKFFVESETK